MVQDQGDPYTGHRWGMIDNTYPIALSDLIPESEWQDITLKFDDAWTPVVEEASSGSALAPCLCLCCCCTLGLSCLALCCLISVKTKKLEKVKIDTRRVIKAYVGELNHRYADKKITFSVAPTVNPFYIQILIGDSVDNSTETNSIDPSGYDRDREDVSLLHGNIKEGSNNSGYRDFQSYQNS